MATHSPLGTWNATSDERQRRLLKDAAIKMMGRLGFARCKLAHTVTIELFAVYAIRQSACRWLEEGVKESKQVRTNGTWLK